MAPARCHVHPEVPAGGVCGRCGGFICEACATRVPGAGAVYCPACAARPEVNYLEALRGRLWGRRDALAWLLGFSGLVALGPGMALLWLGEAGGGALVLAGAAVGLGCFFRQRWARAGLLAVPVGAGLLGLAFEGPGVLLPALLLLLLALAIHQDPRHRLFFRQELPEAAVRRLWERYENNPLARHALQLGLSGVFFPLLAPVAVLLALAALRRVNPEAHPPIGRKGQALAALGLGVGSLVLWGAWVGPRAAGWLRGLLGG